MQSSYDVVVIGGGVMGLATASRLREGGAGTVALLEKRFLGAGSSGKSGAILRQHYSHVETIRMARASLREFETYRERTGYDIGFMRTGMLFIAPLTDRAALETNVRLQQGEGVSTRLLDTEALRELEPRGSFDAVVAAWEDEAGHVDPVRTVGAFGAEARALGVDVHLGCEVQAIVTEGRDGRRVTGLQTNRGHIATRTVVAATGPWSRRLLTALGIDLPLEVVRPEQAFLRPPHDFGHPHTVIADLPNEIYYKPESVGTRVGSISYDDDQRIENPDEYDEGISTQFLHAARARVARRLPAYADAVLWGGGSALYTVTPDAHAVIGPCDGIEGFVLVTGFSGHGFKLSPAVGRGVAEWVLHGKSINVPMPFFDPARFGGSPGIGTSYRFKILG